MNALIYLLQVNVYLLLFYLFYLVLLRNETFFKMNRFYLMGSTLLAMAIPLLKAEWIKDFFVTEQIHQATQAVSNVIISAPEMSGKVYFNTNLTPVQNEGLSANQIFWIIYGSITLLLLLDFFRKLYLVNRAFKDGSKHQAFSFFSKVSIDEHLQGKKTIMDHEMVHVRQWHSLDVIFFELFAAFNWFNPIAFACKKAIKNIHEFIADDSAASTLEDRSAYALLLVSNVFNTQPQRLINNFFNQSLLKRRIIMLHKTKSRKVAILKYGLSVPLFAIMIIFSSAVVGKSQIVQQASVNIEEHLAKVSVISLSSDDKTDEKLPAAKKVATAVPTDKVYTYKMVDTMSEYPGGQQSLYEYFKSQFKYTKEAKEKGMKGQLVARFIVEKDGSLSNIKILSDPGFDTGIEAMRLLQKSAVWKPAYLNKKAVRSVVDFPVNLYSPRYLMPEKDAAEKLKISTKDTIAVFDRHETLNVDDRPSPTSASFPGGVVAFSKYVSENMRYPEEARKNNISGIVSIAFAVNKDGSINNITVPEGIGYGCDEEAIRLIKNSPKWNPGHYPDGSPERMGYSLYIIFQAGKNN